MSEPSATDSKRKRSMSNDELIELSSHLFAQASVACAYWTVLRQYDDNIREYKSEMECSCTFYSIVFKALVNGIFMYLARLFDIDGKSLTLRNLLNELECITIHDLHPEMRSLYLARDGKVFYKLKPIEEIHFPKDVQRAKDLFTSLGRKYQYTAVNLSLNERIHLFRMRLRKLQEPINNLCQQRNKILAHNDARTRFDYKRIIDENNIENAEIHALVEFALDLSRFTYEIMTNEVKRADIINIDDWNATLRLVQVGLQHMTKPIVLSGAEVPDNEPEECT